jgi:hypothetical protein
LILQRQGPSKIEQIEGSDRLLAPAVVIRERRRLTLFSSKFLNITITFFAE